MYLFISLFYHLVSCQASQVNAVVFSSPSRRTLKVPWISKRMVLVAMVLARF